MERKSQEVETREREGGKRESWVRPWKIIGSIRYKAIFKTPILATFSFILYSTAETKLNWKRQSYREGLECSCNEENKLLGISFLQNTLFVSRHVSIHFYLLYIILQQSL